METKIVGLYGSELNKHWYKIVFETKGYESVTRMSFTEQELKMIFGLTYGNIIDLKRS